MKTSSTPRTPVIIYQGSTYATGEFDNWSSDQIINVCLSRYLVVLYYQANKAFEKMDAQKKEADLQKMKEKYNLNTPGRG